MDKEEEEVVEEVVGTGAPAEERVRASAGVKEEHEGADADADAAAAARSWAAAWRSIVVVLRFSAKG